MFNKTLVLSLVLVAFTLMALWTTTADAIPAFARKYKISCTTCHAPIPKLKPYGLEFAGNGFVIPEDESERDYVSAGDPLLWLNRDFPIAARFDAYGLYNSEGSVEKDFQVPWGVKLLSGGVLYKNIGYYFYFYLSEEGKVAGLEDAYLHFNNIFKTNLDLMVGQFQTSDPLMKRELRLTFQDYILYTRTIGDSRIDLTYDRGIMMTYGIEKTGTDLVGLVVNGNGIGAADEEQFDDDNTKNFAARVAQGIGDMITVGGFYYWGKEKYEVNGSRNRVYYVGPDVNVNLGILEFTGQYLWREDSNPFFLINARKRKSNGLIGELIYAPQRDRSRYYLIGLYNWFDSEVDSADYESITLGGTYLLARNLRLVLEYTRDIQYKANRAVLGFVSAF